VIAGLLALALSIVIGVNHSAIIRAAPTRLGFRPRLIMPVLYLSMLAGVLLEGSKMARLRQEYLGLTAGVESLILLVAVAMMLIASVLRVPASLAQILAGAMMGVAVCHGRLAPGITIIVLASWIISPIAALVIAYLVSSAVDRYYKSVNIVNVYVALKLLTLISTIYLSYVFAANAIGLLASLWGGVLMGGILMTTLAIAGMFVLGGYVERRLWEETFVVGVQAVFASQFSAALVMQVVTQLGVPASATQLVVSAMLGSILARRLRVVKARTVMAIPMQWMAGPAAAFAVTAAALHIFPG
jgi:phosphate/sulfate permease